MPVKKLEMEKNTWAANMTRKREDMMEIWEVVKPGATRRLAGVAKTKITRLKMRNTRRIRLMALPATFQASLESEERRRVKTGMKAAEREPITKS